MSCHVMLVVSQHWLRSFNKHYILDTLTGWLRNSTTAVTVRYNRYG